jgi:hypothetical protein
LGSKQSAGEKYSQGREKYFSRQDAKCKQAVIKKQTPMLEETGGEEAKFRCLASLDV